MRKLLLVLALSVSAISFGQERDQGDIEVVPFVGYQQSFFNGDGITELNARSAARFGVNVDYYFNDRWSLRSGLNYDSMGAAKFGHESKLNYLNIPVNANWHFGSTRKWNLNFGLTPGFILSADEDGNDIKEYLEGFQLGISYGIGYKLEISEAFSLMFDIQSLVGVTDIAKADIKRMNAGSSFNLKNSPTLASGVG